jgi:citrate lyase beta subunit
VLIEAMRTTLPSAALTDVLARLGDGNRAFTRRYPGESLRRQPVHTVYGGAHLFRADTARRMGAIALRALDEHAPSCTALARALGMPGAEGLPDGVALEAALARSPDSLRAEAPALWLASAVYDRVRAKLLREPVEDYHLDFEDGFGDRPHAEEDATAAAAAGEVARGLREGTLPPALGIRIKSMSEDTKARAARTLDIFVSTVLAQGGALPPEFVVTLPKVTIPDQVTALVALLRLLETANGLAEGSIALELMIESPQAFLTGDGRTSLPGLLAAAEGRCRGVHLGVYDYTAAANITAQHQGADHPACEFARHLIQLAVAGTGASVADGPTTLIPVGTTAVVHHAWRQSYRAIQRALIGGFYQGWDLHPAQLPVRYAACYAFFLGGAAAAGERLGNFIRKAGQATLVGNVFDDAATGQGLLNFFLRALNCGAVTLPEVEATGLTLDEIQGRSFLRIVEDRRTRGA